MHLTIRHRLFLSNLAAVFLAAVVASIGYGAMLSLETALNAITVNGSALKQQLQADMVHDALRADVLAALIAGPDGRRLAKRTPGSTLSDLRLSGADPAALLGDLRAARLPVGFRWASA